MYQGLINAGATCYLNSLLQTLFMTNQFRQNIYSFVHDPKKITEKDSIPFQLQKLFVNLQTSQQICQTKDLLRSFQWTEAQAFQQHDVQEFCRKLFDAIEASHKNTFWIKQLFGFLINSYIDCGTHRSTRPEQYLDLSLPVRNQYTKQLYNSVEECLKAYLMPQNLQGVECSGCESKVNVKKGMTIQSLPVIFTIQLNRFELNYETMQREKINSFLYYPEILQLHRLLKPYNQIQLKGVPPSLEVKKIVVPKEKSRRTMDFNFPSSIPLPKKRKNSDDKIAQKEHVVFLDEQNKEKRQNKDKELSKQEQKQKNLEILAALKQNKFKQIKQLKKAPPPKQQVSIEDDMLFGTLSQGFKFQNPSSSLTDNPNFKPIFQKTDTRYEHDQESFDPFKQYPEGTYALYAILIHSGGSYGGHYYAYIFDGKDWFKFDDAHVTKVDRFEARQYGSNEEATNGTNAYMLFYRNVKTFRDINKIEIPSQLLQKVKIENEKSEKIQQQKYMNSLQRDKRLQQINSALIVKLFTNPDKDPLILKINDKNIETIPTLKEKIRNCLKIEQKGENWRLRRYNKTDDSMHEVYDGLGLQQSLQSLGFRQNIYLTIEYKKDEEVFEEYDPRKIIVKVNIWKENIIMVTQKKLKPIKILISQLSNYQQLYQKIQKETKIQNVLVIRRNYTSSMPISALIPEQSGKKKLIDLRFFNNINLYVEQATQSIEVKWAKEFQKERYRCNIRFNNPKQGQSRNQEIYFDTRRTLGQLKKTISEIIGIPEDLFRIKKGKQMPQLTTFKKKLTDLRFINNEVLYIQEGKSSQGSIVVKRGWIQLIYGQIQYSIGQELQFDITNDLVTAADLCSKISQATSIPVENIRIREYIGCQFKQIYLDTELIMRLRHKSIIWELFEGERQKGYQIYYRVFDIINMQIGQLKEIFVDSTASYEEFALLLEQQTGIPSDKILMNKPMSTYCDVCTLLDCQWIQFKFIPDAVKQSPLNLRIDGDFILLKEAQTAYKPRNIAKKIEGSKQKGGQAQLNIVVIAEKEEQSQKAN